MKRLMLYFTLCFIVFIIYFDLTTGTLPDSMKMTAEPALAPVSDPDPSDIPFIETKVKPGDTLLTIIEREEGHLPLSIEEMIADFQELNGIKPEAMQIGKIYKIPSY
jgi:hypothetical protein